MKLRLRAPRLAPLPAEEEVAAVLDVDVGSAMQLPPFQLGVGADEVRARGTRRRYRSQLEVDQILAPYVDDARAGVPDGAIAARVGLSREQVRRWRNRHEIRVRSGRPRSPVMARFSMLHLLGAGPPATMHTVAPTSAWTMPEYVIRKPLDYAALCGVVKRLTDDDMDVSSIARGIGIGERDVLEARVMACAYRSIVDTEIG